MKRKISLLLAVIMILSLLPVVGVSAKTDNSVYVYGGTVKSDYEWTTSYPVISVEDKSATPGVGLWQGAQFSLTLSNAEWQNTGTTDAYAAGDDIAGYAGKLKAGSKYTIEYISDSVAEVTIDGTPGGAIALIPLIVEMSGAGAATVTIADVGASGVNAGTYTFATGAGGSTSTTIKKSDTTFSKDLSVPEITILETVSGTIKWDPASTKSIEFVAPNGFVWQNVVGNAKLYLGFASGNANVTRDGSDKQIMRLPLSAFPIASRSANAAGGILVTGLVLEREGSVSETPTGDVKVKVNVPDGANEYVTVGVFANRSVNITAEDKALPEIISGKYLDDEKDESTQVLDFTIKESSANAWNTNTDAVLAFNDGVKLRAVVVKKAAGATAATLEEDDDAVLPGGTNVTEAQSGKGTLVIGPSKITLRDLVRKGNDAFEIKLRCFVTVKPGYTGDITVSVDEDNEAFNSGLSAVVGKAIDPFTVTASTTDVQLGYMNVPVGDIVLKENKAGALAKTSSNADDNIYPNSDNDNQTIDFWIGGYSGYGGVNFKEKGKAEVLSGDIVIDKIDLTNAGTNSASTVNLSIKRASSVASEVKLSGMTIDTNRSIPEGKLELRVGGTVVANYYGANTGDARKAGFDVEYFSVPGYVNIITAAPDKDAKYTTEVAVTVDQSKIVANGQEYALDVAPFIQNNYTMVPTRAVAVALGINDNQIMWDGVTKTVTILDTNRGRTSQFKLHTNVIVVNGMSIPFEGPSVTMKNSRTFLPFRALGEIVLACPVSWDDATRTAFFNKAQ